VKARELIWLLKKDGWRLVRQRGSHRQFIHSTKPGVVTVAGSPAQDLHPKTAASAMKPAGLPRERSHETSVRGGRATRSAKFLG